MGSTSDLDVMAKAAQLLNDFEIPFEMNALSAHRAPDEVEQFAKGASDRGVKVIIAGAGMAAHLPGVIAAMTPLPVIGVPLNTCMAGFDSVLSIVQMLQGIQVATVAVNGAMNAAIPAVQMVATGDSALMQKMAEYKQSLKQKIVKANREFSEVKYKYKTN